MKITITQLAGSRVEVSGELPAEAFAKYIAATTNKYVSGTEVEGFRKGKAPEKMVIDRVGEAVLLERSAEEALQHEWPKILEEHKIEAIGPAEFHITKIARGNDLGWKAIVAVLPTLVLPDWQTIARDTNKKKGEQKTEIEVTDKEIEETLLYIQKVRAPEGKTPPPLDDAYAQSLGNFSTLEALKDNIRNGIYEEKKAKARDEHRARLMGNIAEQTKGEIPDIIIETEKQKMVEEMKANIENMGLSWSDYLSRIKKTEKEITDGYTDGARRRVQIGVILSKIATGENIEPTDDEIHNRTEEILKPYNEGELKNIDRGRVRDYARNILRNEKVFEMLENIN